MFSQLFSLRNNIPNNSTVVTQEATSIILRNTTVTPVAFMKRVDLAVDMMVAMLRAGGTGNMDVEAMGKKSDIQQHLQMLILKSATLRWIPSLKMKGLMFIWEKEVGDLDDIRMNDKGSDRGPARLGMEIHLIEEFPLLDIVYILVTNPSTHANTNNTSMFLQSRGRSKHLVAIKLGLGVKGLSMILGTETSILRPGLDGLVLLQSG